MPEKQKESWALNGSESIGLKWLSQNILLSAPNSQKETSELIDWFSSSSSIQSSAGRTKILNSIDRNKWNRNESFQMHENVEKPRHHRVTASFTILNGVRCACRGFLSSTNTVTDSLNLTKNELPPQKDSYDSAFPTLPAPNLEHQGQNNGENIPKNLIRRKKKKKNTQGLQNSLNRTNTFDRNSVTYKNSLKNSTQQRKEKRRIRPSVTVTSKVTGNLVSLPSEDISTMRKVSPTSKRNIPKTIKHSDIKNEKTPIQGQIGSENSKLIAEASSISTKCEISNHQNTRIDLDPNLDRNQRNFDTSLNRIAQIYSALIMNDLVPSTLLEIHFLLRLLSLPDDAAKKDADVQQKSKQRKATSSIQNNNEKPYQEFHALFSSGYACRFFASKVISSLTSILFNLCEDMMEGIAQYPSMKTHLSDICIQLETIARERRRRLIVSAATEQNQMMPHVKTTLPTPSNTILALPFHPTRDSRHNYRSATQTAIFNNREECRDFFFSKLRSFQNMYSKIIDPAIASSKIKEIQAAARTLIHSKLHEQNMYWFAELFCDLLMKLGNKNIEETDIEILQHVKDGDRLQKLHQRITNKPNQIHKSSKTLTLEEQNTKNYTSAITNPVHFFPGHQEFFFHFLQAVDSHSFGQHLTRRIIGKISFFSSRSNNDRDNREQGLMQQKLLAKFLGVLVFSPNWFFPENNVLGTLGTISNPAHASSNFGAEKHQNAVLPAIPIHQYIRKAIDQKSLIAVIPWVTDFLFMSKWDPISQRSNYYQIIFRSLFKIQQEIRKSDLTPNSVFILLVLESFFANVVGLGKAENTQMETSYDACLVDVIVQENLDLVQFPLSTDFIISFTPHMEELYQLITLKEKVKDKSKIDGFISKKMRPYAVTSLAENPLKHLSGNENIKDSLNPIDIKEAKLGTPQRHAVLISDISDESMIQIKLDDVFFSQHKNLETVATFVVGVTIKNICLQVGDHHILPCVKYHCDEVYKQPEKINKLIPNSNEFDNNAWSQLVMDIKMDALHKAIQYLQEESEKRIASAMIILAAPTSGKKFLNIGINVAVKRCVKECSKLVRSLISSEAPRILNTFLMNLRQRYDSSHIKLIKENANPIINDTNGEKQVQIFSLNQKYAIILEKVMSVINEKEVLSRSILQKSNNQRKKMVEILNEVSLKAYSEGSIVQEAAHNFAEDMLLILRAFITRSEKSEAGSVILFDMIQILLAFNKVLCVSFAFQKLGFYICKAPIMTMLLMNHNALRVRGLSSNYDGANRIEKVVELLNSMIEGNLVRESELERSFLSIIHNDLVVQPISRFIFQKQFDSIHDESGCRNYSCVAMRKIRNILKKDNTCML